MFGATAHLFTCNLHHWSPSSVASGHKLTAHLCCYRLSVTALCTFRTSNKQISLQPHCTVKIHVYYCILVMWHSTPRLRNLYQKNETFHIESTVSELDSFCQKHVIYDVFKDYIAQITGWYTCPSIRGDCNVPLRRTTFGQLSVSLREIHEWNRLPVELK